MSTQLRQSHFQLGQMKDNPASIYTRDYIKKEAEHDKKGVGMNPFRTSSLSKNFKMGENQYLTTNKVKYPEWKQYDIACLDEKKAKDLKTHHFNLGNYQAQSETTNKYYHDHKALPEGNTGFNAQKSKMRGHNHDFKEGPVLPLASVYNKEFGKKEQGEVPVSVKNNEIRQTHIVFGKGDTPMLTTNNIDYSKKEYVPVDKAKIPTNKLVLGTNTSEFKTTNQMYHEALPYESNALPQETMKELRATHFQLGGSRPNYTTEAASYQAHPQANTKPYNPALQRSSKSMAPDNKFYGQTTNQRELPKRELPPNDRFKRQDFNSGWKLGTNEPGTYTTQTSSNYRAKVGQRAEMPVRGGGDEALIMGTDQTNYTTTHRANFTKKQLSNNNGSKQGDPSVRGHHFNLGEVETDKYITVYQDQYRKDQDNKSKLFHRG